MAESLVKFKIDARDAIRKLRELSNATGNLVKQNLKAQKSFGGLQSVLTKLALVETGRRMTNLAASFKQTQIRLRLLSKEYGENSAAQQLAARAADKFGLSQAEALSGITDIYGRLRPIGVTLKEIETTYMGFNVATKLAGVSAQQASGAFLQLSQALGSGRLQGDEYRSIAEQLPILTQAIAKEMGKPVGQIKKLASEGKITSEVVINALRKIEQDGGASIAKLMAESPEQAFKDLRNEIADLSVELGNHLLPAVVAITRVGTEVFRWIADLPEPVKKGAVAVAALAAGFGPLTFAVGKAHRAMRIFRVFLLRKLIPALGLTKAAMGPIVLALTLLTAGLLHLANSSVEAKRAQKEHKDVLNSLNEELITNTIETETNTRTALINAQTWWENRKFLPFASIQYGKLTVKIKESTERLEELNEKLIELPGQLAADEIVKASEAMGALRDITAQTSAQFQDAFAKKIQQYGKTVNDFGGQAGDIVIKSFRGMEDALVRFVQTGKLSFSDFARSIIADMTRIAIRQAIIAPLMNAFSAGLGNMFGPSPVAPGGGGGGGFNPVAGASMPTFTSPPSVIPSSMPFPFSGGKARGGPVAGGKSYLVGERGPELFSPSSSGSITPNNQLGGSTSVVVNVDASGSSVEGNEEQGRELGNMLASAIQAELVRQRRPGGLLAA